MRDTMLVLHFIGLAMGVGTSFAHAFLGKTISKLERSEAAKFRLQIKALSQMGGVGTILLLGSGIYLLLPYWNALSVLPLLVMKLVLFVILVILIVLINIGAKKNFKNYTEGTSKQMELMGKLALLIGVVIVVLAVNVFH